MNKEVRQIIFQKIKKFIFVIALIFIVCCPLFIYFRISTETKICLREAKNIKLAFETVGIQYYGNDRIVYNPYNEGNLEDGVLDKIDKLLDINGDIEILSYDWNAKKVTSFVYWKKQYRVVYVLDKNGNDTWQVDYIINIKKQED